MQTKTRSVRIGEKVGEIDWSFNFRPFFDCIATTKENQDKACNKKVDEFRQVFEAFKAGRDVLVTRYSGWPLCGYNKVLDVGMYDGWPYYKPTPSVLVKNGCGHREWYDFSSITGHKIS